MQYNAIMDPKRDEIAEKRAKYGEQDEWGNDIAMLRANLKKTPAQRVATLQAMIDFAYEYKGAAWRNSK